MTASALPESLLLALNDTGLASVENASPVGGGSINDAYHLTLSDGHEAFLKRHPHPPADFFAAEAAGLEALNRTNTVRVPRVIQSDDQWLLLEWLDSGARAPDYWETFGEQLAALHRQTHNAFGFKRDNFCGLTPQPNPWTHDGFEFFAESRLHHQARLARNQGLLDAAGARRLERVCEQLERWIPEQPPSLIHGDLWGGNAIPGPQGEPVLVDPAAHYGWAEAELAMTTLFGSFPEAFYRSYESASGVASDWRQRTDLYNLYHLLNHLNLFGGGYRSSVERILQRYAG
ncbi:fructosamine kinase family protein [Marinobacteraceae bacterium S3BR75-40.1]